MADRYIETIGRRKTASARVRITPSAKQSVTVNGKPSDTYFATKELLETALAPLKETEVKFTITTVVHGGGISGQAEAVRHGIARALTEHDLSKRTALKKLGFLKRDPRAKERRKPGLKKARKAGQWSKR
ncbi:30S ribosomal protein S9 [Candidatus Kaiserbacteria bacterium]|nr:30S ribosomal protein S9 [Candidatus Kaiserbacteria bacterium]